ncbi:hypothetical protein ACFLUS_02965 [Chloroflexota bacterium]
MDGILNINKPRGRTSFSIVAMVKRLTGERRVGHAGTLDPTATGVLPVCLGQGTRITEFLVEATKAYRAEMAEGYRIWLDRISTSHGTQPTIDSRRRDREQRIETKSMTELLEGVQGTLKGIQNTLQGIESKLGGK